MREEQQVARSVDSQSSDDQDRGEEENYESSECNDEFDGELGRLCRGPANEIDAVSGVSDEECDTMDMQHDLSAGSKRLREDDQGALAALL